ncbi:MULTISPECIES: Hg(II)-responsive transcriptional regulator [Gammaproteobacteria]|jgi:MerR family mercuric resistance operon transcriptional regulator|uniref:Hg(II)-responsive transcriptional regulator n=1 Tax=Gammaproteobacteria TaxID=1236 RepID=UPI0007CFF619|nr:MULTISPECIES: Hg(II)-responsive transcriptional regulator [Gammaproteobacteria]KZZ12259.1 MerR family transcriptional regulator [Oleibacter sp. HI0075]MBN58497.1 Hg(II)-responsive transcriptional regulator [Oceanospirillaceae bacterium]OUX67806.1 MAG: Hg(II)-responsive transcriptional regulator [Oceanospirillaceae bacterium TMED276]HCG77897.1 Hg(II)-responsive transcriptional regulator [Oceanospirillales bacterium]MAK44678.1 Hg(II)-responsive transcriptional regulator [Spongiibacter sp.]|tara:strand:- start:171 stop:575 length:405 start_codon:yes stop_codon:yes gene_type:complete
MSLFSIGKLAQAAQVSVETIRYYERRGLITQPPKPAQGYRTYTKATLARILFIKRAQELGFTLEEIENLLVLGESHCSEVQELAESKLVSVRSKINDLCRLERVLEGLVTQCRSNPDNTACPIVESLQPDKDLS